MRELLIPRSEGHSHASLYEKNNNFQELFIVSQDPQLHGPNHKLTKQRNQTHAGQPLSSITI